HPALLHLCRAATFALCLYGDADDRDLHSLPTRRSSDLKADGVHRSMVRRAGKTRRTQGEGRSADPPARKPRCPPVQQHRGGLEQDRKSTRLNSSHVKISYAVFCLKKKKEQ